MSNYSEFVEEDDINYDKVLQGGGENCGDEDFAVFWCPLCHRIYLMEYEVDTVYTDAHDLKKRIPVFNSGFACVACGKEVPADAWVGPRAKRQFRVNYAAMVESDWAWILNKRI